MNQREKLMARKVIAAAFSSRVLGSEDRPYAKIIGFNKESSNLDTSFIGLLKDRNGELRIAYCSGMDIFDFNDRGTQFDGISLFFPPSKSGNRDNGATFMFKDGFFSRNYDKIMRSVNLETMTIDAVLNNTDRKVYYDASSGFLEG